MVQRRLTKTIVDGLEPRTGEYVEWCGKLAGFGCRVRRSGAKTFIAQYRIGGRGNPTRKVTIGQVGKLTVEEARDAAKEVLSKAALGNDVAAERARKKAELTVNALCDEYLSEGCGHKKPLTLEADTGNITNHIIPLLGRKKIGEVTRTDVERFLRDVAKGKTAGEFEADKGTRRVKGGAGAARRAYRVLSGIFTFAVNRGYIVSNPCRGVKAGADGKGERYLSTDELQRLGDTLRIAETEGLPTVLNDGVNDKHRPKDLTDRRIEVSPHAIAAIRLLLLTGCRRNEILCLKWEHVDFERGVLNLADSKTGAKKVYLSAPALQVLSDLCENWRTKDFEYVIEGAKQDTPRDIKRAWTTIRRHAGLGNLRLHDLRHSFASMAVSSGMSLPMIGKLLGHASAATTQRYAHLADDPVKRAAESTAGTIAAAMGGNAGTVVAIRRAGE